MKSSLTNRIRIQHILDAIAEVETYLDSVSYSDFLLNSEKRFATLKQIEIIGEACVRITSDLKHKHPEIPWREINGFRNIAVHEYFGIDLRLVWEIASNDLPVLKKEFLAVLEELPPE